MTDNRVCDALEQALPQGWALDDAKPIFGSHWQIELVETRDERDVRLSVTAASFAAALESARPCRSLSRLVDALPGQATVEVYVGAARRTEGGLSAKMELDVRAARFHDRGHGARCASRTMATSCRRSPSATHGLRLTRDSVLEERR